ncbi:hypothetical protein [Streptomyces fulvoviolaceus]|uniref:hypothetical protein n=1 Tax=Streptomyces fulvoviolaceus TaxID=285535 RepID=UPI0004C8D085|nr:hypothetical protein [Streptomyces fulvoviolaceus]MCT9083145.1 hypothetical protein [Streptomyces fulvoviolaceus]
MTAKTTFEDRLLAELQGEIERREATVPAPPAGRRLLTGRRLALAAAACAVAGLAVVLVPGSPADSPAYAVERHSDGTVTLTLKDLNPDLDDQRALAERLRSSGINVDIENHDGDHVCQQPRGESLSEGEPVRQGDIWKVTLQRGDSVAFENRKDSGGHAWVLNFYAIKGKVEPCVLTERNVPSVELTAAPSATVR